MSKRGASNSGAYNSGAGTRIVAEMMAGMLLYGGLGLLGDRYWGLNVLLPIGLLLGFGLSVYLVIRRYGGSTR